MSLPALDIANAVRSGERNALDVVEHVLRRIRSEDGDLHCFLEVFDDHARARAEHLDARRARGETLGPLAGVPVAIKDNLLQAGHIASAGSRMLERFVAPCSSTAVERLLAADAVLIGRTNMDEFGMGSTTEHSAFGPTRNPWDKTRVPGGSSGGAAAAVAQGLCPLAIGTDTGGSVRQPAAMCGVLGLKPTYGRISRHGLIAYASSLDCVGPLARTAADLALVMQVLAGHDAADPTSSDAPVPDFPGALRTAEVHGLRLGLPWELNGPGLDPAVAECARQAIDQLVIRGAIRAPCELPSVTHAIPAYYLIATAEASANLARYDGMRYGLRRPGTGRVESMMAHSRSQGFGQEVQLRILLGTYALRAGHQEEFYGQATKVRTLLRQDFARAFASCDLVVCPTAPAPAFPLGSHDDDPLAMYLCDALTVPASLAGLPALSLPCGFTPAGLPVGLQLIAPPLREDLLLQVAAAYQRDTEWHRRRPGQ